jgi:hypothetical protein
MIAGQEPGLSVSHADDDFHRPTSGDPRWIETVWFPFWLPAEGITVHARIWFRPNAGEQGGAVQAWRGDGEVIARDAWTEAFPGFGDLRDLALPSGFRLRCERPLARYHVAHRSPRIEVDVVFDARMEPNPVSPAESPGMFAGHLEQPGRVRGRVRLGEREWAVDCGSVRDRSWGPREMRTDLRLGNAHGTSREGDAFFAYVNPDERGVDRVTSGYLLRDGRAARITEGERVTAGDVERPSSFALALRDALGREARYGGRVVNRHAVDAGQDIHACLSLVEWRAEGAPSDALWGENHDVWSRRAGRR